jgi:hypothetical protein
MVKPSSGFGVLAVCAIARVLGGCVYDPDSNACDTNMHYERALGVCVCNADAVAQAGGCKTCAPDEVVVGPACACAAGETKNSANLCAPVPGLGSTCTTTSSCTEAPYDYCAVRDGIGSCTKKCAIDTDCPDSYVCADWEPIPSCRTYTGYGATCTAADGCASYDANFCISGHCVVHGCTVGVDDCPRDTKCCDFSSFGIGTLCAPAVNCP